MNWTHIIIHHTFSRDHPVKYDWDNIIKYHLSLGWDDVGYHFGIEMLHHFPFVMRGRSVHMQGAHCLGMNDKALGIAIVGNYDEKEPCNAIYDTTAKLCCALMNKYKTIKRIEPHSKYSKKTCPGKLFDMNKLNQRLQYYITGLPHG